MLLLQLSSDLNRFCVIYKKMVLRREDFFCGGWYFSKSVSVGSTFIKEMRVHIYA